jgi:Family of unknown function (DUF6364)
MQTKLTLRLEERLIMRAKAWARQRGISLSQAVATLFEQLPTEKSAKITPWTQRLVGIAGGNKRQPVSDEDVREAYLDHLGAKHR